MISLGLLLVIIGSQFCDLSVKSITIGQIVLFWQVTQIKNISRYKIDIIVRYWIEIIAKFELKLLRKGNKNALRGNRTHVRDGSEMKNERKGGLLTIELYVMPPDW